MCSIAIYVLQRSGVAAGGCGPELATDCTVLWSGLQLQERTRVANRLDRKWQRSAVLATYEMITCCAKLENHADELEQCKSPLCGEPFHCHQPVSTCHPLLCYMMSCILALMAASSLGLLICGLEPQGMCILCRGTCTQRVSCAHCSPELVSAKLMNCSTHHPVNEKRFRVGSPAHWPRLSRW